jgi:hypothetical protein
MKREAQRAARAVKPGLVSKAEDERNVRIIRDGQVVSRSSTTVGENESEEPKYVAAEQRELVVGDKVKLRSFGSVGVIEQIKGDEAEVRVKALRFREKLDN